MCFSKNEKKIIALVLEIFCLLTKKYIKEAIFEYERTFQSIGRWGLDYKTFYSCNQRLS
jgi:hypothetical protein